MVPEPPRRYSRKLRQIVLSGLRSVLTKQSAGSRLAGVVVITALLTSAVLTTPAAAQDRQLSQRIERLERDLQTLSQSYFRDGNATTAGGPIDLAARPAPATDAAALQRINDLERLIQDLTGQVERLGFDLRQMQERITTLEQAAASPPQPQPQTSGPTGDVTSGVVNPSSSALPQEQMQAQPSGTASQPAGIIAQDPVTNPALDPGTETVNPIGSIPATQVRTPLQQAMPPQPKAPDTTTPQNSPQDAPGLYEYAYEFVRTGQHAEAEKAFTDFISRFPDHALTENARYWLAETYFARGDFQRAARAFAEAYQKSPKGTKAPDNLLKLGLSLSALNKKDDACIALRQVEKDFPAGISMVLDRARQEIQKLGC